MSENDNENLSSSRQFKTNLVISLAGSMASTLAVLLTFIERYSENQTLAVTTVLGIVFIAVNVYFFIQISKFVRGIHYVSDVIRELSITMVTGMSNIFLFATMYYVHGLESSTGIVKNELVTSLYFSIVTWTTLGYGDYKPIEALRLIASLEALMGYVYMAILVGLFLSIVKINNVKQG